MRAALIASLLVALFSMISSFSSPLWAEITPPETISLTASERDSLRYHLENIYNELDLLIRNQKVDRFDLKKQERDFSNLQIYQRIPMTRDLPGLKKELQERAQNSKLKFVQMKNISYSQSNQPIPKKVITSGKPFRLSKDQLLERIHFQIRVIGKEADVKNWVASWPVDHLRMVELDSKNKSSIKQLKNNTWQIQAHAFRFRDIQFPELEPKNPREILPQWAKTNPELFSKTEPLLWSFVTRIEKLAPQTKSFYQLRSLFLLNDARLDFFLSKVKAS